MEKEFENLLKSSKYPARNIGERKFDINAQIAAVRKGIMELESLISKYSLSTVQSYMQYIREDSAEAISDALAVYLSDKALYISGEKDAYIESDLINLEEKDFSEMSLATASKKLIFVNDLLSKI